MKKWAVVFLALVASTVAQYGIPDDDDDDDLPPASFQFQPDTLLSTLEAEVREATPGILSSYTKYEDETYDAIVQTHNPSMVVEAIPQSPARVEPIRIAVEPEPARVQTIEENIVFTQQHRLFVPEVRTVDKPAAVFSTVVENTSAQSPTQIRFADVDSHSSGHDFSTSVLSEAIPIVKYIMDNDNRGTFHLETETADGIFKTMSGQLKHVGGSEGPVVVKTGSYRYTGDDGKAYQVDWKADEEGFQAFGDHLPTLPSAVQISF